MCVEKFKYEKRQTNKRIKMGGNETKQTVYLS